MYELCVCTWTFDNLALGEIKAADSVAWLETYLRESHDWLRAN